MRLTVLVVLVAACSREPPSPAPVVSTSALSPTPPSANVPPASSPAEIASLTTSAACFAGDRLRACVDLFSSRAPLDKLALEADAGHDAAWLLAEELRVLLGGGKTIVAKVIDRERGAGTTNALRPSCKPTDIAKECNAQFAGRTVISSCAVIIPPTKAHPLGVALGISYYDATLGDAPMKACLAAKGDWKELAEDDSGRVVKEHRQRFDDLKKSFGEP